MKDYKNMLSGKQWGAIAAAVTVLIALVVAGEVAPEAVADVSAFVAMSVLWIGAVFIYFIPSGVAYYRKHASLGAIVVLNVFGGLFCGLGWIAALVWSFTDPSPKSRDTQINVSTSTNTGDGTISAIPVPVTEYQVGDIVNGHRYNGADWVQVSK